MKVLILYRPNSEHDSKVTNYVRDYKMRTGRDIELMSLDTREGSNKAQTYGIMGYPAVLVVAEDGRLQKEWQGDSLPLFDELSFYAA